jgi:uncharacterized protein YjbJ (UPF0337 family)
VKEQQGKLTDNHLYKTAGKRGQLIGKIQETYGMNKDKDKDKTEKQIKAFEELQKENRS